MRNRPHVRRVGFVAALVLIAAPLAIASAAFADDPSAQSTATVANGQELREQWAIGNNTLITLTADIDLGVDGEGHEICEAGEPLRDDSSTGAITVDGQGLYGITQTCKGQRVLRDDASGETVTLTGLTHFTGGNAYGHGGGLRNNGPVNVVSSTINDNSANATGICELSANEPNAQIVPDCEDGDGGGIFAGPSGIAPYDADAGYDINLTDSQIVDNWAADDGGGVYTDDTVTTLRSTLSGNIAAGTNQGGGRGGGAFAADDLSSTDTSWVGNEAQCGTFDDDVDPVSQAEGECEAVASGGGFFTYGPATVINSTFTNNHAYDSGGGFLAASADVSGSTFTNNLAGGIGALAAGHSVGELETVLGQAGAAEDDAGSQDCFCSGGGFAVGTYVGSGAAAADVPEGGASVVNSTFVDNLAICNVDCMGSGGGFFSGGGATVSGSTFGSPGEDNGNSVGCFVGCGASGGGAYIGGGGTVGTSTFQGNSGGCIAECGAQGGGVFGGSGSLMLGSVDGLAAALPDGAEAAVGENGSLSVTQTTFSDNSAGCSEFCSGAGGGLYASENPTVDVTASTFNDNEALWDGGAISINGGFGIDVICEGECGTTDTTITNSTVTGNVSGYPAAIASWSEGDTLTLVNDTIDSNSIEQHQEETCAAAAVCSQGEAHASECECFAANVMAFDLTSFGTDVTHPILAETAEPVATFADIANCWIDDSSSEGFNFSDDDSCGFTDPTDNVADGNDPMLGALAENGGPTQTMLPQPGSPLIDAIQPVSECEVDVDQRGVSRPQIKGCDTGAVEVVGQTLQVNKRVTGTGGNPVPADGYSFTVTCTDGTSATLVVADATNGGLSDTLDDILPGVTCQVMENPVVYTNPLVVQQPRVTEVVAIEGSDVVTFINDYDGINLLGAMVNITPKFTG